MNYRNVIFAFLFTFPSFCGMAQELDLITVGWERALEYRNQDSVIYYARKFQQSKDSKLQKSALLALAKAYTLLGQNGRVLHDSTLFYCSKIIDETRSSDPIQFKAKILTAHTLLEKGEYMKCMEYILELLNEEEINRDEGKAFAANTELFSLYLEIDDLDNAKSLLADVGTIPLISVNKETIAKNRIAVGRFYLALKKFKKAQAYFNQARAYSENKANLLIDVSHMLAEVEKEQGHFDEALGIYNQLLNYEDSLNHEHGFIHTLLIATETSFMAEKGEFEVSQYAYRAFNFAVQLNNKLRLVQTQVALGYYYQSTNADSAIHYLSNSLALAQEIDALYWVKSSAGLLSTVYKLKFDYKNAYFYKDLETSAAAELRENNQTEIQDLLHNVHLMHQYKQEKETTEHALKKKQYYFIVLLASSLGVLVIALLIFRMYIKQKRHNRFLTEKALNEVEVKNRLRQEQNENPKISTLDDPVFAELKAKIDGFINEKGYLNGECTLSGLAKELATNTAYLSKYINENYNCSFNQFINEYRILDFIERLKSNPETRKTFTLEHLASMSGFNSKSTFIRAFKKHTGITPSIFLQNLVSASDKNEG